MKQFAFPNLDFKDFPSLSAFVFKELRGCTQDSWLEAITKREESSPTALSINGLVVAIPHSDKEHVKAQGLCVCTLKHPIQMRSMMDASPLDASMVIYILIEDPKAHVQFLARLMGLIQNESLLRKIQASSNSDEILQLVNEGLNQ